MIRSIYHQSIGSILINSINHPAYLVIHKAVAAEIHAITDCFPVFPALYRRRPFLLMSRLIFKIISHVFAKWIFVVSEHITIWRRAGKWAMRLIE